VGDVQPGLDLVLGAAPDRVLVLDRQHPCEATLVLLATIRESVYRRSLPLATRDLRIVRSPLGNRAGLIGGAFMVVDELFSRQRLGRWIHDGSPVGRPDLVSSEPVYAAS
jgi:hypothetical protein